MLVFLWFSEALKVEGLAKPWAFRPLCCRASSISRYGRSLYFKYFPSLRKPIIYRLCCYRPRMTEYRNTIYWGVSLTQLVHSCMSSHHLFSSPLFIYRSLSDDSNTVSCVYLSPSFSSPSPPLPLCIYLQVSWVHSCTLTCSDLVWFLQYDNLLACMHIYVLQLFLSLSPDLHTVGYQQERLTIWPCPAQQVFLLKARFSSCHCLLFRGQTLGSCDTTQTLYK